MNNLKHIFSFLFILLGITVFSQKGNKKYQQALQESCHCVEQIDLNQEDYQQQIQACLEETMLKNFEHLAKYQGIDMENMTEEKGYQIGLKFGEDLLKNCEAFVDFSMKVAKESGDLNYENIREQQTQLFYTGKILNTQSKNFYTIEFLTGNGEKIEFILLYNFEHSNIILNFNTTPFTNSITIYYSIIELFSTEFNTFVKYKVITKVEL